MEPHAFPPRPRIAILGSGAVGCYYGGRLAEHGEDVHFLMRSDLAQVRAHGLDVRSYQGDFRLPSPQVAGSTAEIGPCDLVIITLKATANAALEEMIPPLLHPGTVLLTLQNGLGSEEFLAERWGMARVMGGVCFTCINRTAPGVIEHTAQGAIAIGEGAGLPQARTEAVGALFRRSAVECEIVPSVPAVRWRKLVWNVPFNGLAIVGGGIDTAAILADPALDRLVRTLMEEVTGAAERLGHELPPGIRQSMIEATRTMAAYHPSSMIDYVEGREVEVEAIWGEPWRRAAAAGASCQQLEMLYRLIQSAVARRAV